MDNQEILDQVKKVDDIFIRAIKVAIHNGWIPKIDMGTHFEWQFQHGDMYIKAPVWNFEQGKMIDDVQVYSYNDVIWRHDFCKALWGEDYQANMRHMVVSENRALYLNENVEDLPALDETIIDMPSDVSI